MNVDQHNRACAVGPLVVVHRGPRSDSLEALAALARCLGIEVEWLDLVEQCTPQTLLAASTVGIHTAVAFDASSLTTDDAHRVSALLGHRSAFVLILVTSAGDAVARWLHAATDGAVAGATACTGATVAFEKVEPAAELAGQAYRSGSRPALGLCAGNRSCEPVMTVDTVPAFCSLRGASACAFVWSTTTVFDVSRSVRSEFEFELGLPDLVPGIVFLRTAFGDRCFHSAGRCAGLVIDDPLLRRRYASIRFPQLLASARSHGYRATLAFIPWNHWRTRLRDARLFDEFSDCFSLCVHGNDHTEGEFGSRDPVDLGRKADEALIRMAAHAKRTGLPFEPLMVFPQEQYSPEAIRAVATSGRYRGVMNTRCIPPIGSDGATVTGADLLLPAPDACFGMPILKRHYAHEGLAPFAMALFLGRPAVLAEHHGYFRDGTRSMEEFAAAIRQIRPDVTWPRLGEALVRLAWRRRSDSGWILRMFADTCEFSHGCAEEMNYSLVRRVSRDAEIGGVTIDGAPVPFRRDGDFVTFAIRVAGTRTVNVEIRREPRHASVRSPADFRYRAAVAVRRRLSELRDDLDYRAPWLLDAGRSIGRPPRPSGP